MENENALVKVNSGELVFTQEQLEIIQKYVAPGCPPMELKFLVESARLCGMNPIKKECYFQAMNTFDPHSNSWVTKWAVVTSIDMYRKRAMSTGLVLGIECKPYQWSEKSREPEEWRHLRGFSQFPDYGVCKVWRRGMERPIEFVAYWQEFVRTKKDGTVMTMWAKMPGIMICKVAEAGALRRAFPELELPYINDELPMQETKSEAVVATEDAQPVEKEEKSLLSMEKLMEVMVKCETLKDLKIWHEAAQRHIKALVPAQYDNLAAVFKARYKELQEKENPALDEAAQVAKENLKNTPLPGSTTSAGKKLAGAGMLKTLIALVSLQESKPGEYFASPEEISDFLKWRFSVTSLAQIPLDGAMAFYKEFSKAKEKGKLLEIICSFKNQAKDGKQNG